MEKRNIFYNLSPIDHRYYLANRDLFDSLSVYLSEEANIRYSIKVEIALLKTIISHIKNDKKIIEELNSLEEKITPDEVYAEEERTQHNIRSLVNIIKKKVPDEIRHLVHLGATSMDIIDTAFALRIKDAVNNIVLPLLVKLEKKLIERTQEHAKTPQIGRTHGQHAVPITFGFALAGYVSRLGKSIDRIYEKSSNLCGKLSGAVGAYNSMSLISSDPWKLERDFLYLLGLKPSECSTQIVESEYMLELLLEINICFGIIANLADDLRNLQRSEIGEVQERFTKDQVGSSTMPQKRNPWNCENIKSMWKAYCPRTITFFMDQISDHQRDLTNSASSRYITDYIAGFAAACNRMIKVISYLNIETECMNENIKKSGDMILAEPIYLLISLAGFTDAHEIIRKITLKCEHKRKSILEVLKDDSQLWDVITKKLKDVKIDNPEDFFRNPVMYNGKSFEKAMVITEKYNNLMTEISKKLGF